MIRAVFCFVILLICMLAFCAPHVTAQTTCRDDRGGFGPCGSAGGPGVYSGTGLGPGTSGTVYSISIGRDWATEPPAKISDPQLVIEVENHRCWVNDARSISCVNIGRICRERKTPEPSACKVVKMGEQP